MSWVVINTRFLDKKDKLPPFKKLWRDQDQIKWQFKNHEDTPHDLKPIIRKASLFFPVSRKDCKKIKEK